MEDVRRELLDGPDELESGVVDEDVGAVGGRLGGVQVGEVEEPGFEAPGEFGGLLGEGLQAFGRPVDGSDPGPRGGEPQRAGAPDAAGRAGDERGAAGQIEDDGSGLRCGGGRIGVRYGTEGAVMGALMLRTL